MVHSESFAKIKKKCSIGMLYVNIFALNLFKKLSPRPLYKVSCVWTSFRNTFQPAAYTSFTSCSNADSASSSDENCIPSSWFLIFGNKKKSHVARSGQDVWPACWTRNPSFWMRCVRARCLGGAVARRTVLGRLLLTTEKTSAKAFLSTQFSVDASLVL